MMTMRKRVLPLGMAIFLLLTAFFPVWAIAEGEATPAEVPMESVSPYRIILTAPGGWTSGKGAVMKVSITDKDKLGWQKIEYRMDDGNWVDCENLFADGHAELTLHKNGAFTLRVTDPHGHAFEESAEVKCIDLTAPVLTASINGATLQVDAKDDLSGVAGVQVNSMLFTTLVNGTLNVELDANMNQFEKLAVRAFDYAGNFSEPFTLTNPHYQKPADPTPVPTATPEPTAAPTPETIIKTEYITIGPGMPYQADGNSHTLDVLYSAATNKQFITLQTKNGNTFYLVIDYDKPVDEEAEMYETYFLNLVDERDLLALMSDEEKEAVPMPTPEIIYVTPEPTAVSIITPQPPQPPAQSTTDKTTALLALFVIAGIGVVGAVIFLKSRNQPTARHADSELDLDDDDEDESTEQK